MFYLQTVCKAFLLGVVIGVVCIPVVVYGQVISEIMYDPAGTDTGREWVEVHNTTPAAIDLARFKLFESNVNHSIGLVSEYSNPASELVSGGYAVIADNPTKFLEDWPQYSGLLFDSAFSLVNTGEEIRLVDAGSNAVHTISYSSELGAKNTGSSLQLYNGVLIPAEPTPGAVNATVAVDAEPAIATSAVPTTSSVSTHAQQVELTVAKEKPTLPIHAGRNRLVTQYTPVLFSGPSADYDNRSLGKVSFLWNFGDGNTAKGPFVEHVYKHSGTYNVVVNAISGTSRAVARTSVQVFQPQINLVLGTSTVGLVNNGTLEVNLGGFLLDGFLKRYEFPKDTIINPQSTTYFDLSLFGESIGENASNTTPILLFPNKKPVFMP